MDLNTLLLALIVIIIIFKGRSNEQTFSASGVDWFVVFDIDADKKNLTLWFTPIVGFLLKNKIAYPITSCDSYVSKLAKHRKTEKINEGMWGVSVSFGRWVRDNALIDETGTPEMTGDSTFSQIIESYLYGDFDIHYGTTVPQFYQLPLAKSVTSINKEKVSPSMGL